MKELKRVFTWLLGVLKWSALGVSGLVVIGVLSLVFWLIFWEKIFDLPSLDSLNNYRPYQTAYFYGKSGEVVGCVAREWRDVIEAENIRSQPIAQIIVAVEDRRFFERDLAIDLKATGRAILRNVGARRVVEGGSTIPQQLVKQLLQPYERSRKSVARKIKEYLLARRLIQNFSKDQILALYLNEAYFGHQRYGVEAAARLYFHKSAAELTLSDMGILAGTIKSPEELSPKKHPDRAREARNQSLTKAYLELGEPVSQETAYRITEEAYRAAIDAPIETSKEFEKSCQRAPHAIDYARSILKKELGIYFDEAGKNDAWFGLRVSTTLDEELQDLAQQGIRFTLSEYEKRQGENAIDAEGAFVAIENATGAILALVGGKDYSRHQFNNAVGPAKRQIGSAFKPFVYLSRFEQELSEGADPARILDRIVSNEKIRCPVRRGADPKNPADWWEPKNFDEEKYQKNAYTRRFAIAKSINRPAVHTARVSRCGLDPRVSAMTRRLGLKDPIPPYLPSALGVSSHPLIKVTGAYSVIPNKGFLRENYIIAKATGAKGEVVFEKKSWEKAEPAISDVLARIMLEALRGAVKYGTATRLNALKQPIACKTGTTENYTDALLFCFTPDATFGVWIGGPDDYTKSLGERETGAETALPALKFALERWYQDAEPRPFLEESKEWQEYIKIPNLFEQELKESEKSDDSRKN